MDIAFIPETNTLFTTGGDGKILKWNIEDLKIPFETIVENPFVQRAIAVTPDSKYMICGTDDSKINVLDRNTGIDNKKDIIIQDKTESGMPGTDRTDDKKTDIRLLEKDRTYKPETIQKDQGTPEQ